MTDISFAIQGLPQPTRIKETATLLQRTIILEACMLNCGNLGQHFDLIQYFKHRQFKQSYDNNKIKSL